MEATGGSNAFLFLIGSRTSSSRCTRRGVLVVIHRTTLLPESEDGFDEIVCIQTGLAFRGRSGVLLIVGWAGGGCCVGFVIGNSFFFYLVTCSTYFDKVLFV